MTNAEFKQARKTLGLTQGQLAKLFDVGQPEVSHWENGTRGLPAYAVEKMRRLLAEREAIELARSLRAKLDAEDENTPEQESGIEFPLCYVGPLLDDAAFLAHLQTCPDCQAELLMKRIRMNKWANTLSAA